MLCVSPIVPRCFYVHYLTDGYYQTRNALYLAMVLVMHPLVKTYYGRLKPLKMNFRSQL